MVRNVPAKSWGNSSRRNSTIRYEQGNTSWTFKEGHGLNNSSFGTMKQNWNCPQNRGHFWIGWMIRCEKDRNEFQMLQKTKKNISIVWGMFMWPMKSVVFMGKKWTIVNPLWTRQISTSLVFEQDEISELESIGWENHSKKFLSLIGESSKVYFFSDSVWCFGQIHEKPLIERCMGRQIGIFRIISGFKKLWQHRHWTDGIRVEYFPRIEYVAAKWKIQKFTVEMTRDTRKFHRKNFLHVDVSMSFLVDQEKMKQIACQMPILFLYMQKDLEKDNGHFLILVLRKNVLHQWKQSARRVWQYGGGNVVGICTKRMSNFLCYDSIVQMSTKKQRTWWTVDTLFSQSGND